MRRALTIISLILVSLNETALPQAPTPPQDEVIRIGSRLVLVPASVTDPSGQPVRNLTAEDFLIEEEGRPQRVIAFGEPGKTPVELALLFDISGSVQSQFRLEQEAAVRFIREVLRPGDIISIFSVGMRPKLVRSRTASADQAIAGLMALEPTREVTALFDSVVEAARYLSKEAGPSSRRIIVIISDGEENHSERHDLSSALDQLQKSDCLFYSINPSGASIKLNRVSMKGQRFLEAMAAETGGMAFVLEKAEDLEMAFRKIADELRAQYLLGYYSTDERSDGGFRRISVRIPGRPDLRIRARSGYYAPAL